MQKRKPTIDLFCEEPFRVFFPIGLLLGALGVSLWILYYAGLMTVYPGVSHARLMIEGFIASFVIGFLGTAGPRLTKAPHLTRAEFFTLLTMEFLSAGLHFGGANRAGDASFALCLILFLFALSRRFHQRRNSPPPNFVLVGLSLLNGLVGAVLLALFENEAYSVPYRIGAALLQQGFPLLAILGVAPFMLPLLLNLSTAEDLPQSRTLSSTWIARAGAAAAVGLMIDATFLIDPLGLTSIAGWLRAGTIIAYLVAQMPRTGQSFLGNCLRLGLGAIALGFIMETLWPELRIAALHVVFITGFAFVILTVATRVILGHSGNSHLFSRRLPSHIVATTLIALAMFSRVTADLAPRARAIHLVAAAVLWLIAIVVWAIKLFPKLAIVEAD